MVNQLTAELTPAAPADVAGAFVWAYRQLYGVPPSKEDWLYPLAQSAFETAHWTGMWNWNAGNVTTTGDYVILPGNALHFKSYDTLGAGALDMLRWLKSHAIMTYADNADLAGYVGALKAANYFGDGDAASYQAGMQNYVNQYSTLNPAGYVDRPHEKRWFTIALLAGGIAYLYESGEGSRLIDDASRLISRYV